MLTVRYRCLMVESLPGWRHNMCRESYYSHYDKQSGYAKLLDVHHREVAEAAKQNVPPFVHFDVLDNEQVRDLIEQQGLYHDFGKYMDFFQDYLLLDKRSKFQNHAHISAAVFYCFLEQKQLHLTHDDLFTEIVAFLCYVSVRRHHNHLITDRLLNIEDLPRMRSELGAQTDQLELQVEKLSAVYGMSKAELEEIFHRVKKMLDDRNFLRTLDKMRMYASHERWYFFLIYIFSQLVDKDKLSAADIRLSTGTSINPEFVSEYIALKTKNQKSEMVRKRDEVRESVIKRIDNLSDEQIQSKKIFVLTAPTGIGKTLTSMQGAFRLAQRLSQIYAYTPKIITAIPFINIIEQTKIDYLEVLKNRAVLNVHHRLADRRLVGIRNDENTPLEKSLLEVEGWEGDVILTTYVQLFQSLFSGDNARLKKINKLAGSIVILDEVQSIPEKYMPLVGATLIKLAEYYGTRFILMSATQPYLLEMGQRLIERCAPAHARNRRISKAGFNSKQDGVDLLPVYKELYQFQTRTKLIPSFNYDKPLDNNTFIDFFDQTWEKRSAVVVVNTIQRCIDLYKKMADKYQGLAKVFHLSTNLIPKHRKKVIQKVQKTLENNQTVILVSTQTIEAGVDLDFEVGYRDLAPLESIIQTAGRVNRHAYIKDDNNKTVSCPVYVVQIENDHQLIYQLHHLDRTKKLLEQYNEVLEPDYLNLIDTYYQSMASHIAQESIDLWKEGIMKLNFDKISQFKLIPEDQTVVDVFVEADEEATLLADAYEMVRLKPDKLDHQLISQVTGEIFNVDQGRSLSVYQRKALLGLLLSRMSEYMVQIRTSRFKKAKPIAFSERGNVESTFYWVPNDQLEEFYHPEVGYAEVESARMW